MSEEQAQPFEIEEEDRLRADRLSQEWLRVEKALDKAGILNTIVFFGSARIEDKRSSELMHEKAQQLRSSNSHKSNSLNSIDSNLNLSLIQGAMKNAQLSLKQSRFYEEARELAYRIAKHLYHCNDSQTRLVTGGGPGIMEAANRGASEIGQQSIGLNITIPSEQKPNPYISHGLSFEFRYFSMRKMHFLKRAKAIVVFPGGFGTLDELLEVLTLIQTQKISPIPIVLYGSEYWSRAIDFEFLAQEQLIDFEDLSLFKVCDSVNSAFEILLECLCCDN